MFRKWEKMGRILVPQVNIKGKNYLSKSDSKKLLGGKVVITEKLDGANAAVIRHKDEFKLQKRGSLVSDSEHYQFNFFKAWADQNHDKIMQIPRNTILYGELMVCKHTVFYNKLPDFFIPFAWFDRRSATYFKHEEFIELCDKIGFTPAPILYQGHIDRMSLFDMIPDMSNFSSEPAEGIVVWNPKNGIRGKIVRPEFQKFMTNSGHWRHKQITLNKLKDK